MASLQDLDRIKEGILSSRFEGDNIARLSIEQSINAIAHKPPKELTQMSFDDLVDYVSLNATNQSGTLRSLGGMALDLPGTVMVEMPAQLMKYGSAGFKRTGEVLLGKRPYETPLWKRLPVDMVATNIVGNLLRAPKIVKALDKKMLMAPKKQLVSPKRPIRTPMYQEPRTFYQGGQTVKQITGRVGQPWETRYVGPDPRVIYLGTQGIPKQLMSPQKSKLFKLKARGVEQLYKGRRLTNAKRAGGLTKTPISPMPTPEQHFKTTGAQIHKEYQPVVTEQFVRPAVKSKLKIIPKKQEYRAFPRKEQLLKQIDNAIKKAKPRTKGESPKLLTFGIDGGAKVYNTKEALEQFRKGITRQPQSTKYKPYTPGSKVIPKSKQIAEELRVKK